MQQFWGTLPAPRHQAAGQVDVRGAGDARVWHSTGGVLAVVGRAFFDGAELTRQESAETLLAALRVDPESALRRITGSHALAAADAEAGWVVAATDRLGTWPVFWRPRGDGQVDVATALERLADPGDRPDPQQIFNYLYFHVVPAPGAILEGVHRLLPGEVLVAEGGRCRRLRYWQPEFRPQTSLGWEQAARRLREAIADGVRHAVPQEPVGAFLSGGTDSSTVVGMLAEVSGGRPQAFSIGFDAPGYDERDYARAAARHFGADHHEYVVTPEDVVAAVPVIAEGYDQPFGNASVVPTYFCARLAREAGVHTLLGGDGGDELFGGNARYAKQLVFGLYERLPGSVRRILLEPAARSGLLPRKLGSYVTQASVPLPDRMESYNLLHRLGISAILEPGFLETVDTEQPLGLIRDAYGGAEAGNAIDRMLARDLQFTLADDDLVKVRGGCALAGMEVAFPLLDQQVVDLSLQLPPDWKVRRRRLRPFFKEALSGMLPAAVLTKTKHGFGLPFGVWLASEKGLRALAGDSLQSLRRRGIVRPAFLDELLSHRLAEHSAYYGTMVWILMMLEQWYQARERRPGTGDGAR